MTTTASSTHSWSREPFPKDPQASEVYLLKSMPKRTVVSGKAGMRSILHLEKTRQEWFLDIRVLWPKRFCTWIPPPSLEDGCQVLGTCVRHLRIYHQGILRTVFYLSIWQTRRDGPQKLRVDMLRIVCWCVTWGNCSSFSIAFGCVKAVPGLLLLRQASCRPHTGLPFSARTMMGEPLISSTWNPRDSFQNLLPRTPSSTHPPFCSSWAQLFS